MTESQGELLGATPGQAREGAAQPEGTNEAPRRTPRPRINAARPERVDNHYAPRSRDGYGVGFAGEDRPRYGSEGGYQRREGGYQRPGGYRSADGGQHPRRPEGGYTPRSYGQDRPEGGYRKPYGYGGPRPDGGYQRREGAYRSADSGQHQRRPEGGYTPRSYGQDGTEGGYRKPYGYGGPRPDGGYQRREGGYQRPGGYRSADGGQHPRRPEGGYAPRSYGQDGADGGYRKPYGYGGPRPDGGYQRREGGYQRRPGGHQPRRRTPDYDPHAKYSLKKRIEYKEANIDPTVPIRLNRFIANAGTCSRKEADTLIANGSVTVNGQVVTELGTKVMRTDKVEVGGRPVSIEKKVYVLVNKPKDTITTTDDPQERKTVMGLIGDEIPERIYPVGRLDRNTTGVLLLTNDGELASKLTHPKYLKKKVYHVFLDKSVSAHDMQRIAQGVQLDDGEIKADAIDYANETDKAQVGIEIHSGRNRIVRRLFESLGYRVVKLDRVVFAGLTKKNLRRGDWRYLTEKEVEMLQMGAYE